MVKLKLNRIEVFISKALLDTNIIHDDFILVHNELKEYHEMQEELNE